MIDLGSGHSVEWVYAGWADANEDVWPVPSAAFPTSITRPTNPAGAMVLTGLIIRHASHGLDGTAVGSPCACALTFARPKRANDTTALKPAWTITSLAPLTIVEKIKCSCGAQGSIKAGEWIDA